MRHYLSTADFLKLQLSSGPVFERDEVVVTDNATQPIYTYNNSTKSWDSFLTATLSPTGNTVWTALEFAGITPEAGKYYLVEA